MRTGLQLSDFPNHCANVFQQFGGKAVRALFAGKIPEYSLPSHELCISAKEAQDPERLRKKLEVLSTWDSPEDGFFVRGAIPADSNSLGDVGGAVDVIDSQGFTRVKDVCEHIDEIIQGLPRDPALLAYLKDEKSINPDAESVPIAFVIHPCDTRSRATSMLQHPGVQAGKERFLVESGDDHECFMIPRRFLVQDGQIDSESLDSLDLRKAKELYDLYTTVKELMPPGQSFQLELLDKETHFVLVQVRCFRPLYDLDDSFSLYRLSTLIFDQKRSDDVLIDAGIAFGKTDESGIVLPNIVLNPGLERSCDIARVTLPEPSALTQSLTDRGSIPVESRPSPHDHIAVGIVADRGVCQHHGGFDLLSKASQVGIHHLESYGFAHEASQYPCIQVWSDGKKALVLGLGRPEDRLVIASGSLKPE